MDFQVLNNTYSILLYHYNLDFRVYDVDCNGSLDKVEMTHVVKCMYKMHGKTSKDAQELAEEIFVQLDQNSDGMISCNEFIQSCSLDPNLYELLTPNNR